MKILVSNDDGWQAPGITALATAMKALGDVKVVAPDRNCSAASNSLTLTHPIRAKETLPNTYAIQGTPVDCVNIALNGLLDWQPDIVVSGINSGPNLGDDVVYSGTVAAAMEGHFHGLPAIAFSLAGYTDQFDTAAVVATDIVKRYMASPLDGQWLLNVNIPDVSGEALNAPMVTRLGNRHRGQNVIIQEDPRGERIFWIGPVGESADDQAGTDFHAIANNSVSITPIQVDMTNHNQISELNRWMGE
ncbi:MAG: 5'/3'-nucleotidase SurE [Pseudomonadota bacterium]